MAAKKMLIDATHPEETRVVVVEGNRLEEFDFESATRRQLAGNIYLAKVTRVEPSLQAAFVDYGGNRHGFLAFSEIHPDYYQIPIADREALIEEQAAEERRAEEADEDVELDVDNGDADGDDEDDNGDNGTGEDASEDDDELAEAAALQAEDRPEISTKSPAADASGDGSDEDLAVSAPGEDGEQSRDNGQRRKGGRGRKRRADRKDIESVGAEDALDEIARPRALRRRYKIQEVIKRRQILLVQVLKDERGTKGAALTTYLSIPGRYCVLMPNTARGGGISRKITNANDRKRLKKIASDLEVPEGMGLIVRTAGANRTKTEIKRDFEYLLRLWESIRDLTLKSTAPTLVYEEASLIKRAIRDLYNKDIDSVLVEGDEGYREAKTFMRMLMPSHAKNVQPYKDRIPLFQRHQVERQLDSMFNPTVRLKSGGYIVISATEALVAIDVNSGKSTKEASIEATATQTNLEAADEIARQLRLRDLAGLIVIDFIDMDENRNNRAVERRLKESLKSDRARIQVGRISHFGLMEMSRQRLRQGVVETTTSPCTHCHGTGLIRSVESTALHILREVEEEALNAKKPAIDVYVPTDVAIYILNQKRDWLERIEERFGLSVFVNAEAELVAPDHRLEFSDREVRRVPGENGAVIGPETVLADETDEIAAEVTTTAEETDEDDKPKRKRRRRSRKKKASEEDAEQEAREETHDGESEGAPDASAGESVEQTDDTDSGEGPDGDGDEKRGRRRRRRGRRGGRSRKRREDSGVEDEPVESDNDTQEVPETEAEPVAKVETVKGVENQPADEDLESNEEPGGETVIEPAASSEPVSIPIRSRSDETENGEADVPSETESETSPREGAGADTTVKPRRGWWQRRFGA